MIVLVVKGRKQWKCHPTYLSNTNENLKLLKKLENDTFFASKLSQCIYVADCS